MKRINFNIPEPGTKAWKKAITKAFKHPSFTFTPAKKLHKMPEKPKSFLTGIEFKEHPTDRNKRYRLIEAKQTLIQLHEETTQ